MNLRKIIKEELGDFDWIRDTVPNLNKEWTSWVASGLSNPKEKLFVYYVTTIRRIEDLVDEKDIEKLKQRIIVSKENPNKVFCDVVSDVMEQNTPGEYSKVNTMYTDGDEMELGRARKKFCSAAKKPFIKRIFNIKESDDFDWIRQTKPEVKLKKSPYHSNEWSIMKDYFSVRNNLTYKGWHIWIGEMSGAITWSPQIDEDVVCYATPYWNNISLMPIDCDSPLGYQSVAQIEIPEFEYKWEFLEWLDSEYFELVYKIINPHLQGLIEEWTD